MIIFGVTMELKCIQRALMDRIIKIIENGIKKLIERMLLISRNINANKLRGKMEIEVFSNYFDNF